MYKFVLLSVVALVIFQGILAKPKPGKQAVAKKDEFDELAGQARQIVQNVSNFIEGNLPDSKQVSKALTDSSQNFATKVKSLVDDLNKQAQEHKGDIENVLNSVKESLGNLHTKLQEAIGPEATKKAKEVKANLDESFNKAITEAQRLAKAAEPEIGKAKDDLTNAAKTLLDNVVEASKDIKSQLDKNIAAKN